MKSDKNMINKSLRIKSDNVKKGRDVIIVKLHKFSWINGESFSVFIDYLTLLNDFSIEYCLSLVDQLGIPLVFDLKIPLKLNGWSVNLPLRNGWLDWEMILFLVFGF
jgi:hypothetical protein